ncbi:MAG: twin-arginine translocation signal domain-containing protein [Gemmatimonadetes bacterium]|jgi:hypothetical protein|nr:twin-arginine translocation signal domain-containing protein [Gemmatimonadota bacterium]MBT6149765.1 twin-arginine translocation signal domain-containing protein [Gemmatimonadota bacterium]MBT7860251.1 twin-arginine translocation signal domain-containing protein [Gemmatimonadota bacterium]
MIEFRNDQAPLSRRTFLAASAAASAGALVSGVLTPRTVEAEVARTNDIDQKWLVATQQGLYSGIPGAEWELLGGYTVRLTSILRSPGRVVVGGGAGVWEVPAHGWWVQLHDETLTEALGLAPLPGDPGVLVASAYGIATGRRDEIDAVRWSFHSDSLSPDDRFTSAVAVLGGHWIAATEQGVLSSDGDHSQWHPSNLRGVAVRALTHLQGQLWAGSDGRGVWRSDDGQHWSAAGSGLDGVIVYDLAADNGVLLAATERGVYVGDGSGPWRHMGPDLRIDAIGAAGGTWIAGADPGGAWKSADAGQSWHQVSGFPDRIAAIAAPESVR